MKELYQRLKQLQYLYNQKVERKRYRQGLSSMNYRKAHTRTKIQLGGLVVKAGLLDPLNLRLGEDLQKDEQHFDNIATLMGAFLDLANPLQNDAAQKKLWCERGKKALAN
jgi:hypothetical protein